MKQQISFIVQHAELSSFPSTDSFNFPFSFLSFRGLLTAYFTH